jgi:hypothetical protein
VSGVTTARWRRQSRRRWRTSTHNALSNRRRRTRRRRVGRVSTASGCRSKRFSTTRSPRRRKAACSAVSTSSRKSSATQAWLTGWRDDTRELLPSHSSPSTWHTTTVIGRIARSAWSLPGRRAARPLGLSGYGVCSAASTTCTSAPRDPGRHVASSQRARPSPPTSSTHSKRMKPRPLIAVHLRLGGWAPPCEPFTSLVVRPRPSGRPGAGITLMRSRSAPAPGDRARQWSVWSVWCVAVPHHPQRPAPTTHRRQPTRTGCPVSIER